MKKFMYVLLLMFSSLSLAGEDVTVTWSIDEGAVPYDYYTIFWVDSNGTSGEDRVTDITQKSRVIPNVEYGDSQWWMTSTCLVCVQQHSADSNIVNFSVKEKGTPVAPSSVVIN